MASSSFSPFMEGSAPSILGKRKQTPEDLILSSLGDLRGRDFKRLRNKLSDFSYEDKRPIPQGRLENADWFTTKDLLIETYGEEEALDVTIDVFTLMGLMGAADYLKERRAQSVKPKNMTHDKRFSDISKEHRESEKERFQRLPEYNSCMGEAVRLQKRFTKLLMTKGPQNKDENEQKIRSSGRSHLQIMEKRSPTTIQDLFDPDEDGFIPKIVVLQGAAGIGKTMTSKKIMLDWASEDLYQDKFDFVFYLSCREINTIPGDISLVGLLSRSCRLSSGDLVSILEDPGSRRKILIIVDGFDELRWTLEGKSEGCPDISMKTHKEIILQSLLRKQVLKESSLIITTRSLAMEKLNTFIDDYRKVEIKGFIRDDREEYVHKFYGNKEDADKVLSIIKNNEVLYTMCAVPITCWIVCTVMKQEIRKYLALIRCHTTTSIYLLYLEVLLTHHSKKETSVPRKQSCLKKLCALANQGVLNQQIFFEKKDLESHGLSLSEVESVFRNGNIFHSDVGSQTCYNFIHLSVQEFLAALHYGMDDGSGSMEDTFLPEICKGKSLAVLSSQYPHLALTVQFLYGLLNENQVKTFSEITGIPISLRAKPAMRKWTMKDFDGSSPIHAIVCLYETQDENFIRSILSGCSHLRVYGSLSDDLRRDSNYSKHLNYFLKTLKRERFQDLCFEWLTVDPECQNNLSSFLHRSQTVWFENCRFLKVGDEEESTSSEDKMEPANLSWLINSESKIQTLYLRSCNLSPLCCDDLRSVLITNRSLIKLDLSDNNIQDSGIKLLCEGLGDPSCTLQNLSLYSNHLTDSSCTHLASGIRYNWTLRRLDLSNNNLEGPHFRDLMTDLTTSCIEELLLYGNNLTDSSCTHLTLGVENNWILEKLDLSKNNLEGPHFSDLMSALTTSRIKELLLQNVGLTDEYGPFLKSLSNCTTLTVLDVSCNLLTDARAEYIEDLILTSYSLKDVRIDGNYISSKAKETFRKIMDEIQNCVQLHQGRALLEYAPSAESEEKPDNLVAPIVDGKTYRLQLKPGELFCCSKTGIMFKVKSEVTITYELELESDNLDNIQKDGYDVVGPMFNITVEPGVVSEVHLPHSLCLQGLKRGIALIRCGHFKDGKFTIIKPVTIGQSHIVVENPSFSGFVALFWKLWIRLTPFRGKVLLYSKVVCPQDMNYMEYKFHLYVVPRNQPEMGELDKQKKTDGFKHMQKPQQIQCSLYARTEYTVDVQPYGNICPEHLEFESSCETENLSFVEVSMSRKTKELSMFVSLKKNSNESTEENAEGRTDVLWKVAITEGELKEMQLRACASVPSVGSSSEHFVDRHREKLIKSVSNVEEVLDELKNNLTGEQYDIVTCNETHQAKMRMLFRIVRGWGNNGKDKLLDALKKTNKQVIDDLEGQ
ncbi:NACHT, LRR and PYD domains-containing protein 12-like [Rana temporaria]|uniref:NACHT, LRR and PYD domains-containing protein 12-like n=1 Tax=Rana temporaria TaxID=8407 RepID=UPI001AAD519E|nr:NACHT, LRR and PYD domains-containing protein 12-like [Rana temporaria]